jgi:hypothetical protein
MPRRPACRRMHQARVAHSEVQSRWLTGNRAGEQPGPRKAGRPGLACSHADQRPPRARALGVLQVVRWSRHTSGASVPRPPHLALPHTARNFRACICVGTCARRRRLLRRVPLCAARSVASVRGSCVSVPAPHCYYVLDDAGPGKARRRRRLLGVSLRPSAVEYVVDKFIQSLPPVCTRFSVGTWRGARRPITTVFS